MKRLHRGWAAATAGAAALSLALTGCQGAADSGKTVVTFWDLQSTSDTQVAAVDEIISSFNESQDDIEVQIERRAVDAHKDALRTSIGTSSAPDVFFSWAGRGLGGEYIEAGASLDLEQYYDEYGWEDRFGPSSLAAVTQYGGYDGIPYTQRAEAIFYNKELFEQAGIGEPPTTYEELVDAADKLVAAGITPIEFGGTVNWHLMRLLDNLIETECGAEGFDALILTRESRWDEDPCVTAAFDEFALWTQNYVQDGFIAVNNDEASALFYAGQAAMALEGDWFNQVARDNGMTDDQLGIFLFPTGTDRLYGFNENLYISANSEHPDEAAQFLDYLTGVEGQELFVAGFGNQSVNVDVKTESSSALDQLWGPFFANAKGLYANNDQNLTLAETTEYWRIQNLVATGELAPEDAGAEFQQFLDQQ